MGGGPEPESVGVSKAPAPIQALAGFGPQEAAPDSVGEDDGSCAAEVTEVLKTSTKAELLLHAKAMLAPQPERVMEELRGLCKLGWRVLFHVVLNQVGGGIAGSVL